MSGPEDKEPEEDVAPSRRVADGRPLRQAIKNPEYAQSPERLAQLVRAISNEPSQARPASWEEDGRGAIAVSPIYAVGTSGASTDDNPPRQQAHRIDEQAASELPVRTPSSPPVHEPSSTPAVHREAIEESPAEAPRRAHRGWFIAAVLVAATVLFLWRESVRHPDTTVAAPQSMPVETPAPRAAPSAAPALRQPAAAPSVPPDAKAAEAPQRRIEPPRATVPARPSAPPPNDHLKDNFE